MKKSELEYILNAFKLIDDNTTLLEKNTTNNETYYSIICNCQNIINEELSKKNTPEKQIEKEIFNKYKLNFKDLISKSRKRELLLPRQFAIYLLNEYSEQKDTDSSFIQIASIFKKDRGTIRYTITAVSNLIDTDKKIKSLIEELKSSIDEEI